MRLFLLFILCAFPVLAHAQDFTPASESYVRATVLSVSQADTDPGTQEVTVRILSGEDEGKEVTFENTIINARDDMRVSEGETVVMQRLEKADGTVAFYLREKYRLHAIILLTVIFFALGIILGGRIGFTSLIGLAVSIGILMGFIVPRIIAGDPPLLISVVGAMLIASSSLYIAHGFNRRITIALISTICTLILSVFVAVVFVWIAKLYGLGTEESVFLQFGLTQSINLKGVLLGGMIIGALGVLDDITTAQTAAIDELSKANTSLGFTELYAAGTSIGREHIASLINTLALAYAGASLPVLLLFSFDTEMPWWVVANSAFIAEEIVRALVGSCALLFAVPISTWIAAKTFAHGRHTNVHGGHSHVH